MSAAAIRWISGRAPAWCGAGSWPPGDPELAGPGRYLAEPGEPDAEALGLQGAGVHRGQPAMLGDHEQPAAVGGPGQRPGAPRCLAEPDRDLLVCPGGQAEQVQRDPAAGRDPE